MNAASCRMFIIRKVRYMILSRSIPWFITPSIRIVSKQEMQMTSQIRRGDQANSRLHFIHGDRQQHVGLRGGVGDFGTGKVDRD